MNIEHAHTTEETPDEDSGLDTASQERLAWRLGGEDPTEQALELDAKLSSEVAEQVNARKAEKDAAHENLNRRLGDAAAVAEEISEE